MQRQVATLRTYWPAAAGALPWLLGLAAFISHVFAGPMPRDFVSYLPAGTIRAIYLLASAVLSASLGLPALLVSGCLNGFRAKVFVPVALIFLFFVVMASLLSPAFAAWLANVGAIVTSLWAFAVWFANQ